MRDRIGVIGVGNMGAPMAARLLERGFQVRVRDVRGEAEQPLLALGASSAASPSALAQTCDVILVVVVDAPQIDSVLRGEQGLLPTLRPDHLVFLHSTIAPGDATRFAATIHERGALVLDAPISGGPGRARAGQLSMMVAGQARALERAQPVLDALAARVFKVGSEPGQGATMKLVNNLLAGIHLAAGAEALAIGTAAGLDANTMAQVFRASSGQSWIADDRLARMLAGSQESHAQMHILAKDLRLALGLVQRTGETAALGAVASAMFEAALAAGLAHEDDSALLSWRLQSMGAGSPE